MKLMKALVVLLVAAGLVVPAVAIAEDRLSLSGQMRVRAFHTDFDNDQYTDTWANQRLRIAGKIAVAEGVSVTFRTDITEGTNWGDSSDFKNDLTNAIGPIRTNGFGHGRSGAQQQWDRAHLDVSKGNFHLRAGQQYVGTGGTFAFDTQDSGLSFDIVGAMPIKLWGLVDKNNTVFDDATDTTMTGSDGFVFGGMVSPKGDNFAAKLFVAGQTDGSEEEVYLIGASGSTDLGAVKLFGELDVFTGDSSTVDVDAFGTQLFLDASMAATDTATVGGQFFYATGDDEDMQYTRLGNGFNGWDPIFDNGTSLSNEEIALWALQGEVFDFSGNSQGVVGGRLYASTTMGAVKLGASAAYLTVEDDHTSDDELTAFSAGLVYDIAESTSFQLQLQQYNLDNGTTDEDVFAAGTGIFVNF